MVQIKHPVFRDILRVLMLLASLLIIVTVSVEALSIEPIFSERFVLTVQFWVCMVFLADYLFRFYVSENRLKYFFSNLIFLFISIPYMNIIYAMDVHLSHHASMLIRLVPLLRGGYGLAIMIWRINKSKVTGLFFTYLTSISAMIYFASILFFSVERTVNPMVKNYWNALWWACMDVTTVGSNIYGVTVTGQILSVMLAALGMMMFPIFTVYITTRFQKEKAKGKVNRTI